MGKREGERGKKIRSTRGTTGRERRELLPFSLSSVPRVLPFPFPQPPRAVLFPSPGPIQLERKENSAEERGLGRFSLLAQPGITAVDRL